MNLSFHFIALISGGGGRGEGGAAAAAKRRFAATVQAAVKGDDAPMFLRQLSVCDSPPVKPIMDTRIGHQMIVEGARKCSRIRQKNTVIGRGELF